MSDANAKIAVFEDTIVLPALEEIVKAEGIQRDFTTEIVVKRPSADPSSEQLLKELEGALRKRTGPSLVLTKRELPPGISKLGGRYVMTVVYDVTGAGAYAAPGVMFWMRFNDKLHAFAHRYDNAIGRHAVDDITKAHVFNHVLGSLSFFKMYAFRDEPFPGYRR